MTSTAIAPYQPASLDEIQRTAKLLMASGYFDAKGSPEVQIAQLATKIIAGAELGYAPFTAVQGIHVIQGKPSIGANLMAAAVKAHTNYDYRVLRMDNDGVELEFFQLVGGTWASLGVESFTMDDAKAAGLLGKDNWKKFPRNMLFARCISNGVRFRCPDVFNGNSVYVPEELGANVDGDGNVIDAGYTVHKAQNGTHESYADAEVVVDMAAIAEDSAGAMATPQNGNGAKPKAKAAPAATGAAADAKTVKLLNAMGKAAFYADWKSKHDALCAKLNIKSTSDISADDAKTTIDWLRGILVKNLSAGMQTIYADAEEAKADFIETVTEWTDKDGNVRNGVRSLDDATDWNLVFLTDELAKASVAA